MRLLFIGDVMGEPGRRKVIENLNAIIIREKVDFVIVQGENIAGGKGVTERTAGELLQAGVDCITTGNHIWKHKEILEYFEGQPRLLRPANYPEGVPGRGYRVFEKKGIKIGVINLQGRIFMAPIEDPFRTGKKIVDQMLGETPNIVVDFHAEATSEKRALGLYLAGLVTAFIGTHTHVQTADEQVISGRTAYITDAGMVGARDSVIGDEKDEIISHFIFQMPKKFVVAKDNIVANSVIVDFNEMNGRTSAIVRYNF